MYKNLPDIYTNGKVIPKNFGHISHLTGSKMINNSDTLLSEEAQRKFTECKRHKNDLVIIKEKIDGMNAGVAKKNGLLYPVNKKGYDVRMVTSEYKESELLFLEWAEWVDDNYELYDSILKDDERLAFENCMRMHTLYYKFKCKPVFLLAKYDANNTRINHESLTNLSNKYDIQVPPVLNIGVAVPPEIIIKQFPKGVLGVRDKIEGIVYNYEHEGIHESCAKYVSHEMMGTVQPNLKLHNSFI